MKAPKELTKEEAKLWDRLFSDLKPKSAVETEMAKRYLVWHQVFEATKPKLLAGEVSHNHSNGTVGLSKPFEAASKAEGYMLKIFEKLKDSFRETTQDEGAGKFAGM